LKRKKILIVEPSGLLWGSERALLDLLKAVDGRRYELVVACPPSSALAGEFRSLGARVIEGDIGMLHRRGRIARVKSLLWLARLIRAEAPDVIHVNEAGLSALVARARTGTSVPVITHVRLFEDAIAIANAPRGRKSGRYVAISKFIATAIGPGHDVSIIFDPFDASGFAESATRLAGELREELGARPGDAIVLTVGRLCREKGQDLFVEAAGELADDRILHLVVGGPPPDSPGEEWFATELERRAEDDSFGARVEFLGNRDDIPDLMRASDVVVLSSRNEPFGRVILEALSLGKPVVAANRGGPVEILAGGRGRLFATGDSRDLARAIRETLDDPDAAMESARRGREWVASECAPQIHAERIQSLWDEASG
jgi:glycosyltransferase involved in cell wall biosynthesis